MSVLDDLRGLESRVANRLQELRPLVDEYRELEQIAQRLGIRPDDHAADESSGSRQRSARRAQRKRSSRSSQVRRATGRSTKARAASSGQRQEQVASLVGQRPGITVREIGSQLGVDPTSLYRVVRRLEQDGTIKKRGRELHPA